MTLFLLGLLLGVAFGALGASAASRAQLLTRLARPSIDAGPYRTRHLDVVQDAAPKKVYCKDCGHFFFLYEPIQADPRCRFGAMADDPVKGVHRKHRSCSANDNFDCEDWVAK